MAHDSTPSPPRRRVVPLTELLILPAGNDRIAPPPSPLKKSFTDTVQERNDGTIAELLTHFKNLMDLAARPIEEGATTELAAAQAVEMENESSALVRASEDLLQLTRELKELWLFGPLRDIKEGEGEGKMDEQSTEVGLMVEKLLKRTAEAA